MANRPFRVAPSPDRNPLGQFASPPAPNPMAVYKQAEAEGVDMQQVGDRARLPAHSPVQPLPPMKPDAKPMRVK